MMTHAYDEVYLDDAMECLGAAVEYATLICGIDGQAFFDMFITSGIAAEFGRGNVTYISGMSGIELARRVLEICGVTGSEVTELPYLYYPAEYWAGWILARYQWQSGKAFSAICKHIRFDDLMKLYGVLHEADPGKAMDIFDQMMENKDETNLARLRKAGGFSQSQLARQSGVSVRTIQLFEQRQTNIRNAQYNHLSAIARVLGCQVEDLLDS